MVLSPRGTVGGYDAQPRTSPSPPGADPADASLNLANRDGLSHEVVVSRVELLNALCGSEQGWGRRKRLDLRKVDLAVWNESDALTEHPSTVAVPADVRTYQLTAHVAAFSVYQVCDRFGYAFHLVIDGQETTVEVPLKVKRMNAIRR